MYLFYSKKKKKKKKKKKNKKKKKKKKKNKNYFLKKKKKKKKKKENSLLFLECLLQECLITKNEEKKNLCMVLFRSNIQPNGKLIDIIPQISWVQYENILFTLLKNETNKNIYFAICDAVGIFASH